MRFGSVTTSNPAAECQFALTLKIPPTFRKLLLLGCLNSLSLPFFHPRPSERLVFGTWTCGVGDSCRERLTAIGAIVQHMASYDMADCDIYGNLTPTEPALLVLQSLAEPGAHDAIIMKSPTYQMCDESLKREDSACIDRSRVYFSCTINGSYLYENRRIFPQSQRLLLLAAECRHHSRSSGRKVAAKTD